MGSGGGADASEVEITVPSHPPSPPSSIGPFPGFGRLAGDDLTDMCGESCHLAEGLAASENY